MHACGVSKNIFDEWKSFTLLMNEMNNLNICIAVH